MEDVSIHAPARGATLASQIAQVQLCFNPRSRTGSDFYHGTLLIVLKMFQSTLPHGERL